jgi:polyhydroxybutyrate depolymerase
MAAGGRRALVPSTAITLLALGASCSSSSGRVDAGGDARTAHVDSGHDARRPPTDARHDSARDSGHDAGPHAIASLGAHTTGVSIRVATASGAQTRTFDITVPAVCDASHLVPLLFAFHGDGGNAAGMYGSFPIEQAATAAGGQAIFVYPDGTDDHVDPSGTDRAWDLFHDPGPYPYAYTPGHPAPADSDQATGNADVDFFDTMVEAFEKAFCVDRSKVFITGMSDGGYFVNQLARWRSTVVKGVAPQSGGAPFGNPDGTGDWQPPNYCVGTTGKVPALIIHGAADSTVDPCNAVETQSYWELADGCSGSAGNCTTSADTCTGTNLADPSSAPTSPSSLNGLVDSGSDCLQTEGCGAYPVVFCEIPGMGHQVWTGAPEVVWSFFASL